MSIEYRVCWSASSNISFRGATDWTPWDDDEATAEEVERDVSDIGHTGYQVPLGMEEALEASGFEWFVETREAQMSTPKVKEILPSNSTHGFGSGPSDPGSLTSTEPLGEALHNHESRHDS